MKSSKYLKLNYILPVFSSIWSLFISFLQKGMLTYDLFSLAITTILLTSVTINGIINPYETRYFRLIIGGTIIFVGIILAIVNFNPTRLIQILLLGINHIAISIAPFFGLKARGRGSPSKGVRTPEPGPEPDPEPEPSPEPL